MILAVASIPASSLGLAFIPVLVVLVILFRWSYEWRGAIYAIARMVIQLILIGYLLRFLFAKDAPWLILSVLSVMLLVSAWIGIRHLKKKNAQAYTRALLAVATGSLPTLLLIILGVMREESLNARLIVPLAGMVFPPSMHVISLIAERLQAESERGVDFLTARGLALKASLIPVTNSLLAVGLVSLPGMMTGQVLAGVNPMEAVRYQIMVMCMIFGASGLCAATYLHLLRPPTSRP